MKERLRGQTAGISLQDMLGTAVRPELLVGFKGAVGARFWGAFFRLTQRRRASDWLTIVHMCANDLTGLFREAVIRAEGRPKEEDRNVRVLEVGAGKGYGLLHLAGTVEEKVYAGASDRNDDRIPIEFIALDIDKKAFPSQSTRAKTPVKFVQGDGQVLPFPDEECDVIFGIGVLNYFADQEQGIKEMDRVLRPGGVILIHPLDIEQWVGLDTDIREGVNSMLALFEGFRTIGYEISLRHIEDPRGPQHLTTQYSDADVERMIILLEEERGRRFQSLRRRLPQRKDPWLVALSSASLMIRKPEMPWERSLSPQESLGVRYDPEKSASS